VFWKAFVAALKPVTTHIEQKIDLFDEQFFVAFNHSKYNFFIQIDINCNFPWDDLRSGLEAESRLSGRIKAVLGRTCMA
jgi:hypothetical protein